MCTFLPMPGPPPLSVAQAARDHSIPKRTLQHAITAGHLKAHKLPGATGAYLIDPADLTDWLAGRTTKATA